MLCLNSRTRMLKIIVMVLLGVFTSITLLMVYYWRDVQYQPDELDLLNYLVVLPLLLSMLLLMPYIWQIWKKKQQQKADEAENTAMNTGQLSERTNQMDPQSEHLTLVIYTSAIQSGLGENDQLLSEIIQLTSPTLDPELIDLNNCPILSYRITDIDELLTQDVNFLITNSAQRVWKLINHQLQQYGEAFQHIAKQLQCSALFYDPQPIHEYQPHPAWSISSTTKKKGPRRTQADIQQPITTLHGLDLHLILPERFISLWNEQEATIWLHEYLTQFQIVGTQVQCHYYYYSQQNHYTDFLDRLASISRQSERISLLLIADSEIDQEYLDKQFTSFTSYLPAEFSCSCLIASPHIQIEHLKAKKTLHIINNQKHLIPSLNQLNLINLEQYQQDIPFVYLLKHTITTAKKIQKLQQFFAGSLIETEHYLYSDASLGQSNTLAQLYSFFLAIQANLTPYSLIYSLEHDQTQAFVLQEKNVDPSTE